MGGRWVRIEHVVLGSTLVGLAAGITAWFAGHPEVARIGWGAATLIALLPLTWGVVRDLRRGRVGVDVIALLAMAGALLLGEVLAGAVIALMLSGGQVLEAYASHRARRELSALAARAPRHAHLYTGGRLVTVEVEEVHPGDRIMVKPGEVVPVDGSVADLAAVVDESAITGEANPVEMGTGDLVRSGSVNAGAPFDLHAAATAEASTYAAIVRLTREASASKAPFVRMADRLAVVFLPFAVVVAAGAWVISGDPVRALAVLVVATPCPLILAAPVAIVAGISRAASRGVVVKGGAALEAMARATVVIFDKTGTLTAGSPVVLEVESFAGLEPREVLRLAASLDQVSPHVLAAAVVAAARARGSELEFPSSVEEVPGCGIQGVVGAHQVGVGKGSWLAAGRQLPAAARRVRSRGDLDGRLTVFVAVDGELAGALVLEDPIRDDTPRAVRGLREAGIERVLVVTGDRADAAQRVGAAIGADGVLAEREPGEKLAAVRAESGGAIVLMVGDGINDAPALAAADVGVAMGARGATASSEAADVVIVVDRIDRLVEGIRIARRSHRIALQSVFAGMGLSMAGMVVAALGYLPPVAGAVFQEAIDVLVILNALRALTGGMPAPPPHHERGVGERFRAEHGQLRPELDRIRQVADRLDAATLAGSAAELAEVHLFLVERLIPHEEAEDATLFPLVAGRIGGTGATDVMSREHAEIRRLTAQLGRLLEESGETPGPGELADLRRVLYGLHAILALHFAQEEESYLPLVSG